MSLFNAEEFYEFPDFDIRILNGIKFPEENPKPYQNPSQLNLLFKELKVKTKDNLTLLGWLVYKKEKTQLPTILHFAIPLLVLFS